MALLHWFGFFILVFLPGAWITFGLALPGLAFWAKLCAGAILAPAIVAAQFYALRLVGISFEQTASALVAINLPASYLIWKQRPRFVLPEHRALAASALAFGVPLVFIARALVDSQGRMYSGHAWLYSDPIYLVANGALIVPESLLAGVRYAYPWLGLVYQAVLSYTLNEPPASSYLWTNLLWLVFISGFAIGIVTELGGKLFSGITSLAWLYFGVNLVGFTGYQITFALTGNYFFQIFGDPRYTPWILKFLFLEQEPLALGAFIAILFLLVQNSSVISRAPVISSEARNPHHARRFLAPLEMTGLIQQNKFILLGFLLCGMGLLYPPLFPATSALLGAQIIARFFARENSARRVDREMFFLGAILVIAGALTFVWVKFLTVDRVDPAVLFAGRQAMFWKAIASVVVTLPLLIGFGIVARAQWRARQSEIILLGLGAVASFVLLIATNSPGFGNEYKFIFTAAICLAPFPALALETFFERLGAKAVPVFGVMTLLLAAPLAYRMNTEWPWFGTVFDPPRIDAQNFEMRLLDDEILALTDAIRARTPANSILVLKNARYNFPTLTGRALYVPPDTNKLPGVNVVSDDILGVSRGYARDIVSTRRQIVADLFDSNDATRIAPSLDQIRALKQPVALVLETARHAILLDWLKRNNIGASIFNDARFVVWLIQ